ncbi:MAG: hypothetical protein B6I20_03295 [Bacteroidetes bacterium 4572_117]|nr:MAG: hypothetical protein B6I20_03295 [Bacteroidetes bacterium 4572_117]
MNCGNIKGNKLKKQNAQTGICKIIGESYLEESSLFYKPIYQWLVEYLKTKKPLVLNFGLSYVNTSSSKHILYILRLLKESKEKGIDVQTNWYIEHGDTDTEEDVEDYMIITGMEINLIKNKAIP